MTDAWGTVTAVDGQYAYLRMDESGCGRCRQPGGCGGNHLGPLWCGSPRTFRVLNPDHCDVGARVQVTVAEGSLSRSLLYAYAAACCMHIHLHCWRCLPVRCRDRPVAARRGRSAVPWAVCWSAGWACGERSGRASMTPVCRSRSDLDLAPCTRILLVIQTFRRLLLP